MILDANKYRLNVKYIAAALDDKTTEERYEAIGPLAISTSVPIIIVATYVGELYGLTDELQAFIGRLKDFYTVTEVLNATEIDL